MFLVDQLVRLLSNPAGSIAYHLVTLFAIQATLAIAFWQWWRKRADGERDVFAWRLMVGAGGMLALRLTLLLITLYLFSMDNALLSLRILPPLEQAVNTATLALIVWALLPAPQSAPQLMNVLVVVLLLLTAFLFAIFTRSWWLIAGSGATYHDSQQTTFFSILQLSLAGGGILWLLFSSRGAYPLRLLVLLVLLLAQLLHFWGYPAGLPATSSIPFWTRLGYLIVLPVLAVIAYRHTLRSLLYDRESRSLPAPMESGRLALAMSMLDARGPSSVAAQAACYAANEMAGRRSSNWTARH